MAPRATDSLVGGNNPSTGLGRRCLDAFCWGGSLVAALITFVFFLTYLAPGDPARIVLGPNANETAVAELRREMGLNRPILVQFANYARRILTGQWGESWLARRSVFTELGDHLAPTIGIACVAVAFSLGAALLLNAFVFAWPSLRPLIAFFRLGVALPGIVVAMATAIVATQIAPIVFSGGIASFLAPGFAAGLYTACLMTTLLHDRFGQVRQSSAFRSMKAFGFGRLHLLSHGLLSNSRSLLVTLAVNQLGLIFFSTIVAEQIFSIRGIGALLVRSIQSKDLPMIAAIILCNGLFFLALQSLRGLFFPEQGETTVSRTQEVVA